MARSRRRTQWLDTNGSNIVDDRSITDGDITRLELASPSDISAFGNEPTLIRIVGRIGIGSAPADTTSPHTVNCPFGICLTELNSAPSPSAANGDERWLLTGYLRSVYINEPQVYGIVGAVGVSSVTKNQPGPWEVADFDARAMRKARDGDSLVLCTRASTPTGTPASIKLYGYVRSLWKMP